MTRIFRTKEAAGEVYETVSFTCPNNENDAIHRLRTLAGEEACTLIQRGICFSSFVLNDLVSLVFSDDSRTIFSIVKQ